jgi:hypothetical protein
MDSAKTIQSKSDSRPNGKVGPFLLFKPRCGDGQSFRQLVCGQDFESVRAVLNLFSCLRKSSLYATSNAFAGYANRRNGQRFVGLAPALLGSSNFKP